MAKHHIIAGGAGFIGLNLARRILKDEESYVTIIDNNSNAHLGALKQLLSTQKNSGRVKYIKADISEYENLVEEVKKSNRKLEWIQNPKYSITKLWHMAANSDIQSGMNDPRIDLRDTFMTTFNLLNLCRCMNIKKFVFASSSAIYGDHGDTSITENTTPLMPISNYGAMKLASEAICLAAKHEFLESLYVFRFPNVVGTPATHGVIYDFVKKLKNNPDRLDVLGNGSQKKSYLHVSDLVEAMVDLSEKCIVEGDTPVFNLGPSLDSISVKEIAEYVRDMMSPKAEIKYGDTNHGWKGDIPRFSYNIEKASTYGWRPSLDSKGAIKLAVNQIVKGTGEEGA